MKLMFKSTRQIEVMGFSILCYILGQTTNLMIEVKIAQILGPDEGLCCAICSLDFPVEWSCFPYYYSCV